MAYLVAAVVILGLLCLLNLVLNVGLIRRVRTHTDRLDQLAKAMSPYDGVPVGERVDDFTATTVGGAPVSRDLLIGRTLVGFFSPGCQPCATELPLFIEYARSMPDGPGQVLAVVTAADAGGAEYVERLAEVARVVVEGHGGALKAAFQVAGFPMLYLLGADGVVLASGFSVAELEAAGEPEVAGHGR